MRVRTIADIGALIRDTRRAAGMDQQHLADRIGTSRLWVNQIEGGKPSVRLDLTLRALGALGVELRVDLPEAPTASNAGRSSNLVARVLRDTDIDG